MLKPLSDTLILKIHEKKKDVTILTPDSFKAEDDPDVFFEIVATGPGYYDHGVFIPSEVKEGDIVMITSYGLSKFTYNGSKVILGRARDVVIIEVPEKGGSDEEK